VIEEGGNLPAGTVFVMFSNGMDERDESRFLLYTVSATH
jgi:hypothetical protein